MTRSDDEVRYYAELPSHNCNESCHCADSQQELEEMGDVRLRTCSLSLGGQAEEPGRGVYSGEALQGLHVALQCREQGHLAAGLARLLR